MKTSNFEEKIFYIKGELITNKNNFFLALQYFNVKMTNNGILDTLILFTFQF